MDLELSNDDRELRQAVRGVCISRLPLAELSGYEPDGGLDRQLWADLDSLGLFSMREVPPKGTGLGLTETSLAYQELGSALAPGPVVWTQLAAHQFGIEGRVCGLDENRAGSLVENLAISDSLLVVDDKVRSIDVLSIDRGSIQPVRPIDPLTPVWRVTGVLPEGDIVGGEDAARILRRDGAVLVAAQLAGIASATKDLAVAYAGQREQFGRPIGSFQAIKHLLADMLVRAETAEVAVHSAAVAVDGRSSLDVDRAVASAKVVASESAIRNSETCVQIHGGMGFAWELPAHLYLKRSWVLDTQFGSASHHALTVSEHV
jgi:alkylation response protein AidB-like acyl-CoA dehydrogenase